MKFAIISDTHSSIDDVVSFLLDNKVDFFIHAGDYTSDAEEISYITGISYKCVKGNNDYYDNINPEFMVINVDGINMYITHGHRENIHFGYEKLAIAAKNKGCSVAIFGHNHLYVDETLLSVRLLNPGSPSLPRDSKKSMMLCNSHDGKLDVKKITF